MSYRSKQIDDDALATAIRELTTEDGASMSAADMAELLDELLRFRRVARGDSRRAEQLKKMRWIAENLLAKVEALSDRASGETLNTLASEESNA